MGHFFQPSKAGAGKRGTGYAVHRDHRVGECGVALLLLHSATAAWGQGAPPHRDLEVGGVDLAHGDYQLRFVEGSIGTGDGMLQLVRQNLSGQSSQWDNIKFQKTRTGNTDTVFVMMGKISETWTGNPGNYTSALARGNVLTGQGASYTFQMADGTSI